MHMNNTKDLLQTIEHFYSGDPGSLYSSARHLANKNGAISVSPLAEHSLTVPDARLVSLDLMTDELACAEIEYSGAHAYCRETLGLLRTEGRWMVICAMSADMPCRFVNPCENDAARQSAENAEIENLLLRYCHDVYRMNTEDCLSLFWDGTRMYHPNGDNTFSDVEIQVLNQRWKDAPDPRALGIEEFSRICHFEMLSDSVVSAKIGCAKLDNYFNDYLWLMKLDGKWVIVNKMTQCLHSGARI